MLAIIHRQIMYGNISEITANADIDYVLAP